MLTVARPVSSLLAGVALLLTGAGLLGTLLAVRAVQEGFPERVIGLVMSGYFAGFLLGTWLAPRVIRRAGHIRAFAIFASLASSTALLHALKVDPWTWALLRIATGSCLVSLYMIVESWLNAQAPPGQRGQIFAAYMIVNFLALAAGQGLLLLYPPGEFAGFAIVALLLGWSLVPVSLTRIHPPAVNEMQPLSLRRLHQVSPAGVAGAFGSGFAMGAFWGLGPVAAQRMGLETAQVAAFMVAAILGGAVIQWPVGHWSDRHDRRRVLAAVCAGAAVLALAAYALREQPLLLMTCMFAFGGLAFTVYPVSIALANDLLQPEELVAGAGTLLLVHGTGAALGPMAAGQTMALTDGGGLLLHFATVLLLLAGYVGWRALRAEPVVASTHFAPMVRTTPTVLELLPEAAAPPPEREDAIRR
ncbi:MAG TPA: MFS transporter [Solimonas sp.]